jgi:hypothetical protein
VGWCQGSDRNSGQHGPNQSSNTSPGGSIVSSHAVVIGGIIVGFIVIPMVAGAEPEIVNGLLLLMLFGALLMNSTIWLPYLKQFGNATSKTPAP